MDDSWIPTRLHSCVSALVAACQDDPDVRAAWVGGSLARDTADDWSDIDLHLLVADAEGFGNAVEEWFGRIRPTVLAHPIPGVAGGFVFVTPDWVHVDVIVHDASGFEQGELPARVLVDPEGLVREVPAAADEMVGRPYLPMEQVELYLYFMGVTVTVVHRREWLALAQGAAAFRDSLLIPLMLAENGVRKTDGAKRLNRYLTLEQIAAVEAIPAIGSDPQQLVDAHRAIAQEYLTRARRLAALVDEPWPSDLEHASRELWHRELDITLT